VTTERRAPTTEKEQAMIEGGRVKSGIIIAIKGSNDVTFNTAFVTIPRVMLTAWDAGLLLRDCLYKVTSLSATGFTFEVDEGATYGWIATDAGNP